MPYTLEYSDPNNRNIPSSIKVNDANINRDTDLVFVGKNYTDYAKFIGENFLHLLENFASTVEPKSPVMGQLWYDTASRSNQLKVFNGSSWVEANGIKKSSIPPSTADAGNLWVDQTKQQLYLYSGTRWILVGPQFGTNSASGVSVEEIIDSATNAAKTVLQFSIDNTVIAMFSIHEFVPKTRIDGFSRIYQGITLSTKNFNLASGTKFWGTSEQATALLVGSKTVPSTNFLRSDTVSTTDHAINIRSNSGLRLGRSLETNLTSNGTSVVLKTSNAEILLENRTGASLKVNDQGVGISSSLDVFGPAKLREGATLDNSLTVKNGITVINGNITIDDEITLSPTASTFTSIIPVRSNEFSIGNITSRFNQVHATEFVGETFKGTFEGNLTGVSESSKSLTTPTLFTMSGDVILRNAVSYNGTNDVSFNTIINDTIVTNRDRAVSSFDSDDFLVYQERQLKKISKSALFAAAGVLPVGTIMPYAGDTPPPGTLFCDGSEQDIQSFPLLFDIIKFKFTPPTGLRGINTFALPDLRGRFPLGMEIMDNNKIISYRTTANNVTRFAVSQGAVTVTFSIPNGNIINGPFQVGKVLTAADDLPLPDIDTTSAAAVIQQIDVDSAKTTIIVSVSPQNALEERTGLNITSIGSTRANTGVPNPPRVPTATSVGISGGNATQMLKVGNLPDHEHNLKGSSGTQFYAINDQNTVPTDVGAFRAQGPDSSNDAQFLPTSGGILTTSALGQPLPVMNPYLTVNYIIFTGRF